MRQWKELARKGSNTKPESWFNYLDSTVWSGTGVVAPFVIEDKDLRVYCLRDQVVVIERLRKRDAVHRNSLTLPDNVYTENIGWVEERAVTLPQVN